MGYVMSHFIKLTHADGEFLVNMDLVLRIWPRENGCALRFVGEENREPVHVGETPAQILEKL